MTKRKQKNVFFFCKNCILKIYIFIWFQKIIFYLAEHFRYFIYSIYFFLRKKVNSNILFYSYIKNFSIDFLSKKIFDFFSFHFIFVCFATIYNRFYSCFSFILFCFFCLCSTWQFLVLISTFNKAMTSSLFNVFYTKIAIEKKNIYRNVYYLFHDDRDLITFYLLRIKWSFNCI